MNQRKPVDLNLLRCISAEGDQRLCCSVLKYRLKIIERKTTLLVKVVSVAERAGLSRFVANSSRQIFLMTRLI